MSGTYDETCIPPTYGNWRSFFPIPVTAPTSPCHPNCNSKPLHQYFTLICYMIQGLTYQLGQILLRNFNWSPVQNPCNLVSKFWQTLHTSSAEFPSSHWDGEDWACVKSWNKIGPLRSILASLACPNLVCFHYIGLTINQNYVKSELTIFCNLDTILDWDLSVKPHHLHYSKTVIEKFTIDQSRSCVESTISELWLGLHWNARMPGPAGVEFSRVSTWHPAFLG